MPANLAWFAGGLVAMIVGAEALVRAGSWLASQLGIRPIIVGLTVVSIGTSMPELAVGVVAATEGNGSLAVGNIAGTNMVNLLLILGLSALILPLAMQMQTLRFDLPVIAAAGLLLWALAANGVLSRLDGLVLVLCAIAYTAALIRTSRRESREIDEEFAAEYGDENSAIAERSGAGRMARHVGLLLGGIVIVVVGADWLVDGAVGMARAFGVSDALIGLTVVAIGTSAPELVTTVVSTVRGERDIAIGNLLGSSIYNILLILGITALVPAHGLVLDSNLVRVDIPIMVVATLACVPIFITGRRVGRVEGGAMMVAYLAYLAFVLMTQI